MSLFDNRDDRGAAARKAAQEKRLAEEKAGQKAPDVSSYLPKISLSGLFGLIKGFVFKGKG
jgi:hypothetical protein